MRLALRTLLHEAKEGVEDWAGRGLEGRHFPRAGRGQDVLDWTPPPKYLKRPDKIKGAKKFYTEKMEGPADWIELFLQQLGRQGIREVGRVE